MKKVFWSLIAVLAIVTFGLLYFGGRILGGVYNIPMTSTSEIMGVGFVIFIAKVFLFAGGYFANELLKGVREGKKYF